MDAVQSDSLIDTVGWSDDVTYPEITVLELICVFVHTHKNFSL